MISTNFMTVNAGALMDALVSGTVRQIMNWLNKAERLLNFIPSASSLFSLINTVLSTAGNYIDEAVLSQYFSTSMKKTSGRWPLTA